MKAPRFPFLESVMNDQRTQPYIHDCLVEVLEGRAKHFFRVFFKNHLFLPLNKCGDFRGDAVIMRVGKHSPAAVVNMREKDIYLADFIMRR